MVASGPTCTEPGETIHTAWFINPAFLPQAKTVDAAPLGHDWGAWTVTKEAAQGEEGTETRTCGRCGATETRAIPKVVPGKAAYRCAVDVVTWTKGSSEPAVFTFKRNADDAQTFDHFTGFEVDGAKLDAKWYDAASGSVIVSVKPDYLEMLSVGEHSVKALFDDGDPAEGTLVVRAQEEKERDGEEGGTKDEGQNEQASSKLTSTPTVASTVAPSSSGSTVNAERTRGTVSSSSARTPNTSDPSLPLTIVSIVLVLGVFVVATSRIM